MPKHKIIQRQEDTACDCLTSEQVQALSPHCLTYRELDYWTRLGLIGAHWHEHIGNGKYGVPRKRGPRHDTAQMGSGYGRGYPPDQAAKAVWMAGLGHALQSRLGLGQAISPSLLAALWDGRGSALSVGMDGTAWHLMVLTEVADA